MSCKDCRYAPTSPEEFLFSCIHPELYCPDAYTEHAPMCGWYDLDGGGSEHEVKTEEEIKQN